MACPTPPLFATLLASASGTHHFETKNTPTLVFPATSICLRYHLANASNSHTVMSEEKQNPLRQMKYPQALAEAKRIARQNIHPMVVVSEGVHRSEYETDFPSFGYCPAEGHKLLYKYGTVVAEISPTGRVKVLHAANGEGRKTYKMVGYAYPTSTSASLFGFGTRGCWCVRVDRPAVLRGKPVIVSKAVSARAGIGAGAARRLAAAMELARRAHAPGEEKPVLDRPEKTAAFMVPVCFGLEIEKFWVLTLNRKNRLIRRHELTSGTANAAVAHPREVFRVAVTDGALAIICVHNHPSGDPAPSQADAHVTRQLRDAAVALDIALLDHVIVGRAGADPIGVGYFSFRNAGAI
jgi:DNA repair protein RadC